MDGEAGCTRGAPSGLGESLAPIPPPSQPTLSPRPPPSLRPIQSLKLACEQRQAAGPFPWRTAGLGLVAVHPDRRTPTPQSQTATDVPPAEAAPRQGPFVWLQWRGPAGARRQPLPSGAAARRTPRQLPTEDGSGSQPPSSLSLPSFPSSSFPTSPSPSSSPYLHPLSPFLSLLFPSSSPPAFPSLSPFPSTNPVPAAAAPRPQETSASH